jgi:hypothetical protein
VLNNYLIFKIHFGRVKIIIYGVFGVEYIGSFFGRFCGTLISNIMRPFTTFIGLLLQTWGDMMISPTKL